MLRQAERAPAPQLPGGGLWRRWVVAVSLGEFAGFLAPSAVGGLLFALAAPETAMLPPMVVAGAAEGAVLGFAQATVLRRALPGFSRRQWVGATAAAAAVAWGLGMTQMVAWETLEDAGTAVLLAVVALLDTALLLSLPAVQWRVLRRHVRRAWLWIPGNVLAWAAGISLVILVMSPSDEGTPAVAVGALGALGGALMAVTVAAVTGAVLVWLLARSPQETG